MIILLLIQTCYSSILIDKSTNNNITDLYTKCQLKGENSDNLLFQCSQMNVIIPIQEITQDIVFAYSFNKTKDVQLSNMLLTEFLIDQETQSYQIKLHVLYNSYYGDFFQMIQFLSINKYSFFNYQVTVIDGTLNMIALLMSHVNENYITLYLIPIYASKMNSFPLTAYNFTCDTICEIKGFSQYYNKQRNSLVIVIAEENLLNILQFSFFDEQLRFVSKYYITEFIDNQIILKTQLFEDYLLVELKNSQALFSISSIVFEIQLLKIFSKSPLFIDHKTKLIFQQSLDQTIVYAIQNQQNWFTQKQVIQQQILDILFTGSIIVENESEWQFIFIYDNFQRKKIKIQIKQNINQESECLNNFTQFPYPNKQTLNYQLQFLQEKIEENNNKTEPLQELQNHTSCQKPCDLLYFNYEISLVPYDQQCIISKLQNQFTNHCSLLNSCINCNKQTGCNWENNTCMKETQMYQIDISSHEQSSKWYNGKIWKCQEIQQKTTNSNFCNYDQNQFEQLKEFTYKGEIRKGQICSWFFDAGKFQQFNFYFKADLINNPTNSQISICLGLNQNDICTHVNFKPGNLNSTTIYPFKGYYFRYMIIFMEDNLASEIKFSFQNSPPISITDRVKQSLLQMLAWLICGILLFCIMGYMAKRRLQYLVAQTTDNELIQIPHFIQNQVPLSNEGLKNVMQNLIDQEIITKYPSDPSLLLYGEDSCAFCFDQFDTSELVAQLFCGHVYHYDCFEDWIRIKGLLNKCPVCNQKVDYFLANKEEFAIIKLQIMDRISESESHTTHLIE
ncbi:unnamed protein product [Paramecium sonneborni]|uniref:RING-type domain-containing protein n=1 Tax=Paramecium sonneborni TaxID=65129 RepID=A0A8S1KIG9_9CILI|nr:unnamed protein product [Paramecium sonneborni]